MQLSICGKQVDEWSSEVIEKWQAVISEPNMPEGTVTACNYFTPRPWRNEYDRGSKEEGFVYTINRHVWQVIINQSD